jgi:hypothetical protein
MVEKTALVIDSVRRLVRLKVSDDEVLTYLQDVGFSEQQAVEILAEAKGKEGVKEEEPAFARAPEPEPKRAPVRRAVARTTSRDLSKLWEKGIIVTVNDKLDEMKKVRKNLDKVLDKKVAKAMTKEHKRMEVLFESRKALMVNKINKSLDDKAKEVQGMISKQLAEIKKLNLATQADLDKVEAKKALIKDIYIKSNQALLEMKETKVRLQKEVTVSLEASKDKVAQLDERVSRTLELESKITEGLVADARDRMEEEIEARLAELEDTFKRKLVALKAQPPPEVPTEKIRKEVQNHMKPLETKFDRAKIEVQKQMEKNLIAQETSFKKHIKELKAAPAPKGKAVNVKKEVKSQMKASQAKLDAKLKQLDAKQKEIDHKIKELHEFKKSISSEINSLLSTLEKRMLK